jgi:hypothetical protein
LLKAAVLVGGLVLVGSGAHGVTQVQAACTLTRSLVVIDLDDESHRHIIDHALDARRAGHKRILHIRRGEAAANRRASLRGIPTKKATAATSIRRPCPTRAGKGADVRYVRSAENRTPAP